jgi:hypothetical protein
MGLLRLSSLDRVLAAALIFAFLHRGEGTQVASASIGRVEICCPVGSLAIFFYYLTYLDCRYSTCAITVLKIA